MAVFVKQRQKYNTDMKELIYGITNINTFINQNSSLKYMGKDPIERFSKASKYNTYNDINVFGSGISNYFRLTFCLIVIFGIATIISCIMMYINYSGSSISFENITIPAMTSLGNLG